MAGPAGLMLARARESLGAEIPARVPAELLGRRLTRVLRLVDRVSPREEANGRLATPSPLVSRSMGQGIVGAVSWFLRRSVRNLDPREPAASSAFTSNGGTQEREAFVRAVVAVGRRGSAAG